jgi:D-alanyl-D-alanine carboxypeptidase
MLINRRTLLGIGIVGLVLGIFAIVPAQSTTIPADAAIDAIAQELVDQGVTAGVAVAVMKDGELLLAKGYGYANLEHAVRVHPNTVFRVASITKQFTAAAVLLLAEQKRLDLDDKLSQFFPDCFAATTPTIREALTHTSGIHSYTDDPQFADTVAKRDFTTTEFVRRICEQNPLFDFAPGTASRYSNSGYYLLGALVEKISGQSLGTFLRTRVFAPHGLSHTAIDDAADVVPHRATGYAVADGRPGTLQNAAHISMSVPAGAGALRSTVGDLALWHHFLFSGRIVSPDSLALMIAPALLRDGRLASTQMHNPPTEPTNRGSPPQYGLGLMIVDTPAGAWIGHTGNINGFANSVFTLPKKNLTVVVLANTQDSSGSIKKAAEEIQALAATWR